MRQMKKGEKPTQDEKGGGRDRKKMGVERGT